MTPQTDLTGKILIAMPGMGDPRFARAVVLICTHSEDGAMGLILNHPLPRPGFRDLMHQLEIEGWQAAPDLPVRLGGPVEPGRGFVLHPTMPGEEREGTMDIGDGLSMTTTRDILEDLSQGRGPQKAILALGYAGWGPGQLDAEIRANGWLTADMNDDYAFGSTADVWQSALHSLGVNPLLLSEQAGRA